MRGLEEQELIRRAASGDAEAFEALVLAYQKPVYNLALRMSGSEDEALDLSQEAFFRAWRGLSGYRADSAFSTWLYRLTSNVCLDHLRRRKRRILALPLDGGDEREPPVPDPAPGPEARTIQKLEREAVAEALGRLGIEYREALTLRALHGLSYGEIAEILDLNEGTVKSRIARAREKMRRMLQKDGNRSGGASSNRGEGRSDAHDL